MSLEELKIMEYENHGKSRKRQRQRLKLQRQKNYYYKMKVKIAAFTLSAVAIGGGFLTVCKSLDKFLESDKKMPNPQLSHAMQMEEKKNNEKNIYDKALEEKSDYVAKDVEKKEQKTETNYLGVGTSELLPDVQSFLESPAGDIVRNYSEQYGVDANLMGAIFMQESKCNHEACCPGGSMYNGAGVGIGEIEVSALNEITAYNYSTGQYESQPVTIETASDLSSNIEMSCKVLRNTIDYYDGNILLALQSYNYGKSMLDNILNSNYSDVEQLKQDYSNVSWMQLVKDAHINHWKYIDGWADETYGDGEYLTHVLQYCPEDVIKYKMGDVDIEFNLKNFDYKKSADNEKSFRPMI